MGSVYRCHDKNLNNQAMSTTFNNLVVGLGGVEFPVPDELKSNLKDPYTYLGQNVSLHFPTTTNDPCAGYFFDGIPLIYRSSCASVV